MADHPFVLLHVPLAFRWDVTETTCEIDELMAPLIQVLWDARIDTIDCCQGDKGDGYVGFAWFGQVMQFYDAVGLGGPRDEVYERLPRTLDTQIMDMARDDDGEWVGPPEWHLYPRVGVEIHTSDVPELTRRFLNGRA
jgi:hypothetical protein